MGSCHITALPKEIGKCTALENIYAPKNNITSLPKEIGNLVNLAALELSNNKLKELPKEIGNCTKLKSLELSSNLLSTLPEEIIALTPKYYMTNFSQNYLSEERLSDSVVTWLNTYDYNWKESQLVKTSTEGDGVSISTNLKEQEKPLSITVNENRITLSQNIKERSNYSLYSIKGQTITNDIFRGNSITLPALSAGVYLLQIHNSELHKVMKFSIH